MHTLRTIRAFSVELIKEAAQIRDAEIRKLLAERKGEEYLEGGRLLSNTEAEAQYASKLANGNMPAVNIANSSGSIDVLKSKKKKHNLYQTSRDYVGSGVKGGLTGLGILGAYNVTKGRFGSPSTPVATRQAVTAAKRALTAGSGLAIADRAYRHDDIPGINKTSFAVSANPTTAFKSPGMSLAESGSTGSFKSNVIHDTGKAPQSVQLGRKFRIP